MALVVLLRGVNVGGHRSFRPTHLAEQLRHLDVVNIGAAGTFVVRRPVTQARLRAEVAARLPFEAKIIICRGRDILSLVTKHPFGGKAARAGTVRFLSVLSAASRLSPRLPLRLPATGRWLLRIVARDRRFIFGEYRRHMKVIGYLGALDRLFGVPVTTRGWSTVTAIAKILDHDAH